MILVTSLYKKKTGFVAYLLYLHNQSQTHFTAYLYQHHSIIYDLHVPSGETTALAGKGILPTITQLCSSQAVI